MSENNEKVWTPTKKRYVAFFDYLGFSNYVMRNSHSVVLKRMLKIHESMESMNFMSGLTLGTSIEINNSTYEFSNYNSKATMFSDSFVIFTESDSKDDFFNLILQSIEFFQECIINNIPIKGAISHGTITADFEKNIFFGKAVIDAYRLEEELQLYGIVIDSKCEKAIKKFRAEETPFIEMYNVPFKGGKSNNLLCNWLPTKSYDKKYSIKLERELLKYRDLSSGLQRKYIDNTIQFYNKFCEQNENLTRIKLMT